MSSNYFIANKEAIGLGMIYAIIVFLSYCILSTLFSYIKTKLVTKKNERKVTTKESEFNQVIYRAKSSSQIRKIVSLSLSEI